MPVCQSHDRNSGKRFALSVDATRNGKLVCRCGRAHGEAETTAKLHLNSISQHILGKTVEMLKLVCCVRLNLKVFPVPSLPFSHLQMLLAVYICMCVYKKKSLHIVYIHRDSCTIRQANMH